MHDMVMPAWPRFAEISRGWDSADEMCDKWCKAKSDNRKPIIQINVL